MRNWFLSLEFRLIFAFTVVLAITLVSVSLFIRYQAQAATERFDRELEQARAERVEQFFTNFVGDSDSPPDLQRVVDQASRLSGRHIVVTNEQGEVIAESHGRSGRMVVIGPDGLEQRPFRFGQDRPGSFGISPNDAPDTIPEPAVARVASAVNRSLIWAGVLAGIGGILLLSFVSKRVLGPIQNLESTAQKLGQGDLSQRANVSGPSEIQQLAQNFNTMAQNLQNAEQQRRIMVADIAHELRTPMSNIQGYVEAIKDGVLPPDEGLETIHKQTLHLSRLIEDLRLLSLAETGNLRLILEEQPLEGLLSDSVQAVRARAEARRVSVALDTSATPSMVNIDRTRIAQVVGNLLDNAIFHTPEGGSVTVSSEKTGDVVRVTVADTGEGIPQDMLPMIFERFYRVDPSRARATGGTGLGLTIAKQLVELHGGTIHAESAPGEGSRFVFELPLARR